MDVPKSAAGRCRAVLFDLDGVLTSTARLHAKAWKATFDGFLKQRAANTGENFVPFDADTDYRHYVDGKPRADGVRAFLAARQIHVDEGEAGDPATAQTVQGIGACKNEHFQQALKEDGIQPYPDAVALVQQLHAAEIICAVVSSSANAEAVLDRAGIARHFRERVDGRTAADLGLRGKPAPDAFLEAARRLGVEPAAAAVIEDATAGVQAGRAGDFGWVIGVARRGDASELYAAGAHRVVSSLDQAFATLTSQPQEPER